jgi:hypothetical protein
MNMETQCVASDQKSVFVLSLTGPMLIAVGFIVTMAAIIPPMGNGLPNPNFLSWGLVLLGISLIALGFVYFIRNVSPSLALKPAKSAYQQKVLDFE